MNLKVTPREKQILDLYGLGYAQKEIADTLNCSIGTVDTHIKNAKRKMGLNKAGEISCAVMYKKYSLPLIDLPEIVRKRIAAALLVLSLLGMVVEMDNMLRVVRTSGRAVRTVRTARARRSARGKSIHFLAVA